MSGFVGAAHSGSEARGVGKKNDAMQAFFDNPQRKLDGLGSGTCAQSSYLPLQGRLDQA